MHSNRSSAFAPLPAPSTPRQKKATYSTPLSPAPLRLSFKDTQRNLEKATTLLLTHIRPRMTGFSFRFSLEKSMRQEYMNVVVFITASHTDTTPLPWDAFKNVFNTTFKKHGINVEYC